MLTIEQIRAARALLDWSQQDLAGHADLSQTGIARIENGTNKPNSKTLSKIESAFDRHDIEFIGTSGLRKRSGDVRTLKGPDAMSEFLDDVYYTAIKHGTEQKPTSVFLSNVVHQNWIKWMGDEKWKSHTDRMVKDKNLMDVRIILKEGDEHFPAKDYSKYKWMEEQFFNEKSFYSYHNRLAFLDFRADDLYITIIKNKDFAKGYRDLFLIAWDNIAKSTK